MLQHSIFLKVALVGVIASTFFVGESVMTPATRSLINSAGLLLLGSFLTYLAAQYWWNKNEVRARAEQLARDNGLLLARVTTLEGQLSVVTQTVQPISIAMQNLLIKELTHFHTPEMDALMQRIGPPSLLTDEEDKRLDVLLKQRAEELDGQIPELEREAALILPYIMKRARLEQVADAPGELKVVTTPKEPEK